MNRDPIPRNIPLDAGPDNYDFEACIDKAPRTQDRAYTIRMTGPGRIKLRRWRIRGSGAAYFTLVGPGEVELGNGDVTAFTLTFRPAKVREYKARLTFAILFFRPNGSSIWINGRVQLIGFGKACVVVDDGDEELGDGDEVGGGDAPGGDSNDDADDGDAPEDNESSDTGTDPDGGGSSPGTEPPAAGTSTVPETTVCVRFWKLPGIDPNVNEAALDQWIESVNPIYRGSGVKFERSGRPFERSPKPNEKQDPHCLDIYLGGPNHIPGGTTGATFVPPRTDIPGILEPLGAHADFSKHSGLGTSIVIETGSDRTPASTLAHELGHALGLGAVPDPDAPIQEHLDPSDGRPITDPGRLMHPAHSGTKLTDRERRVARAMAQWVRGGPRYVGCDKTSILIPEDRIGERTSEGESIARVQSFADALSFTISVDKALKIEPGFIARIVIARHSNKTPVLEVAYRWCGESWIISAPPADSVEAQALSAPAFIRQIDGPSGSYGLQVDIPKSYLGQTRDPIGVGLQIEESDKATHSFLSDPLATLDLTPPRFVLQFDDSTSAVKSGGRLKLSGKGWQSPTFDGQVLLELSLEGKQSRADINLDQRFKTPIPLAWEIETPLPANLPPGRYRATLRAHCPGCGASTTITTFINVIPVDS